MRDVPQPRIRPWTPPDYEVDADGKVVGAEPGEPHNWGRWGDDDERGTANLFTPERIVEAAALIRTGKRFGLGLPIGGVETPTHRQAPLHYFRGTAGDTVLDDSSAGVLQVSDDWVTMALQATTQVDGLAHFGADHLLYNGYWAGLVASRSGARRLGIHHLADGLVGRAVLLDVARHLDVDALEAGQAIDADQLEATARAQGVEVKVGDVVLVRTGWMDAWFEGEAQVGREPGVSKAALPWLADRDVAMVATDTPAVEPLPAEEGGPPLAFHVGALRDLGLLLGELFDLAELAADCADDGVYEAFFVASVLPVVGGAGSPANPLVLK